MPSFCKSTIFCYTASMSIIFCLCIIRYQHRHTRVHNLAAQQLNLAPLVLIFGAVVHTNHADNLAAALLTVRHSQLAARTNKNQARSLLANQPVAVQIQQNLAVLRHLHKNALRHVCRHQNILLQSHRAALLCRQLPRFDKIQPLPISSAAIQRSVQGLFIVFVRRQ